MVPIKSITVPYQKENPHSPDRLLVDLIEIDLAGSLGTARTRLLSAPSQPILVFDLT